MQRFFFFLLPCKNFILALPSSSTLIVLAAREKYYIDTHPKKTPHHILPGCAHLEDKLCMLLESNASQFFFWRSAEPTTQGQNETLIVWEKDAMGSKGQEHGGNHDECQTEGKTHYYRPAKATAQSALSQQPWPVD